MIENIYTCSVDFIILVYCVLRCFCGIDIVRIRKERTILNTAEALFICTIVLHVFAYIYLNTWFMLFYHIFSLVTAMLVLACIAVKFFDTKKLRNIVIAHYNVVCFMSIFLSCISLFVFRDTRPYYIVDAVSFIALWLLISIRAIQLRNKQQYILKCFILINILFIGEIYAQYNSIYIFDNVVLFTLEYCIHDLYLTQFKNQVDDYGITAGALHSYFNEISPNDKDIVVIHLHNAPYTLYENEYNFIVDKANASYKDITAFKTENEHIVLIIPNTGNIDFLSVCNDITEWVNTWFVDYNQVYKVIALPENTCGSAVCNYIDYVDYIEDSMQFNTLKICTDIDTTRYERQGYIVDVLRSITESNNLCDDRVAVYFQPVLDTKTRKFSSAESLMRLLVDDQLIYPDEFIPLAEKLGYIHTLSLITLNKVCRIAEKLIHDRYIFKRISVNFSISEIRDSNFVDDIMSILNSYKIPYSAIAIELTESTTDADFHMLYNVVSKLHSKGISFYLDDFGTGYSNFERIMKLPFDVIKFDKSLTDFSKVCTANYFMINQFANIFTKAEYSVLFEGIEDLSDEERCISMNADYLQGYRYSKPKPIDYITDYFTK